MVSLSIIRENAIGNGSILGAQMASRCQQKKQNNMRSFGVVWTRNNFTRGVGEKEREKID